MPFSSRKIASSRTAPRIRLATKPGISLRSTTGSLPSRRARSATDSTVATSAPSTSTQRRVEEVHVGDAVRASGGVGELRRHDRRRVRGEDCVRRCQLVEAGEELPLDVQLLDGCFDHEVRGRRGAVEARGEREPGERGVDVVAGAAAVGDVAIEPRTQGRLRASQHVVGEVGDGRVVAGEGAHHGDLRAHRARADDEHSLHGQTHVKAGGRFSKGSARPLGSIRHPRTRRCR
jgi:hypothetical protein